MSGETNLSILLRSMRPVLCQREYVFCSISHQDSRAFNFDPVGLFREAEGLTLVLQREQADAAALPYTSVFCMITLSIHSSLEAVGFLAAITGKLAEQGISVNPISAYYHDHLFVPASRAQAVMALLQEFSRVTIRRYTDDDLDNVVTLWYRSWTQAFPTLQHSQPFEQWKSRFHNEYARQDGVWVAVIQDQIVGFMVVSDRVIAQIFVDVEVQRTGVGTALLNQAKRMHPNGLSLTTLQQNEQARQFYQKHGFAPGATGINPINGQPSIEYRWRGIR